MAKFEISTNDLIQGIYEAEGVLGAVIAYARDAGIEEPTCENRVVRTTLSRTYVDWGHEYTEDDYVSGEIRSTNQIGTFQYSVVVREVETADASDFTVYDYRTGSEIFGALMDESGETRYDAEHDRIVFYDDSKHYWEAVHADVDCCESIKRFLDEEAGANMEEIEKDIENALYGLTDLDEIYSAERKTLEEIYHTAKRWGLA